MPLSHVCRLNLITPPALEPVTLAEAKEFLKLTVTTAEQDAFISNLITAARIEAEKFTGLVFITQTWQMLSDSLPPSFRTLKMFGGNVSLFIPKPPLQSVVFVKTVDKANDDTIIAATDYFVSIYKGDCPERGRVTFCEQFVFPSNDLRPADGFIIQFIAGFGNTGADVPYGLRNAILQEVAFRFENSGDCNCEGDTGLMSTGAIGALRPYKRYKLCDTCTV